MPQAPNDVDRDRLRDFFVWASFFVLVVIAVCAVFGDDLGPLFAPAPPPPSASPSAPVDSRAQAGAARE